MRNDICHIKNTINKYDNILFNNSENKLFLIKLSDYYLSYKQKSKNLSLNF